jgi:hypothetical protein
MLKWVKHYLKCNVVLMNEHSGFAKTVFTNEGAYNIILKVLKALSSRVFFFLCLLPMCSVTMPRYVIHDILQSGSIMGYV